MTQKLKRIENRNSKQHAHFTTFCIREQQQQKLQLQRIQWYFFFIHILQRWRNKVLRKQTTSIRWYKSWIILSNSNFSWYLITPKELRIWKWKWSSSVVSDPLQPHGLYSLPGSSVHGVFQARVLEWFVISWESEWANILFTMKICNKCCHI